MNGAIAILGTGSWGSTLAFLLARQGYPVRLWGRSPKKLQELIQSGHFLRPLDLPLPPSLQLSSDLNTVCQGAESLICAIPSPGIPNLLQQLKENVLTLPPLVISTTKGLDEESGATMSQLWRNSFPSAAVAVLSGPNLSYEAATLKPMKTMIAAQEQAVAEQAAAYFSGSNISTTLTDDLLGLELCGAAKNVIALAAGAWDGFELGTSGKGCLLSRSLEELTDLVVASGGRAETVCSVGGLGDLLITCSSTLSRNYRTGFALAQGQPLEQISSELAGQIAEGVNTAHLLQKISQQQNSSFGVCDAVCQLLQTDARNLRQLFTTLL